MASQLTPHEKSWNSARTPFHSTAGAAFGLQAAFAAVAADDVPAAAVVAADVDADVVTGELAVVGGGEVVVGTDVDRAGLVDVAGGAFGDVAAVRGGDAARVAGAVVADDVV